MDFRIMSNNDFDIVTKKSGAKSSAEITSLTGKDCYIHTAKPISVTCDDTDVTAVFENGRYIFKTEAEKKYNVTTL